MLHILLIAEGPSVSSCVAALPRQENSGVLRGTEMTKINGTAPNATHAKFFQHWAALLGSMQGRRAEVHLRY